MSDIDEWTGQLHEGHVVDVLRRMPSESVHCAITSPPYYGLRDYGVEGQIGLEDTLEEYIASLVDVGSELMRVLRNDGSWWLNIGDSYAGGGGVSGKPDDWDDMHNDDAYPESVPLRNNRLGKKNKMLVPHRTAIALQEAGWIIRNDCVWYKPNPMPSSVTDRLNTTFEFFFHLVKKPKYYYDLDAIREPFAESTIKDIEGKYGRSEDHKWNPGKIDHHGDGGIMSSEKTREEWHNPAGKNPGDVFEVTVAKLPEAHFAVFPRELIRKPMQATCPWKVCVECDTPYERDVDRTPGKIERSDRSEQMGGPNAQFQSSGAWVERPTAEFKGWTKMCDCETDETQGGIVLDPFIGSGTTAIEAENQGKRWIGIDLNGEYFDIAEKRLTEESAWKNRTLDQL